MLASSYSVAEGTELKIWENPIDLVPPFRFAMVEEGVYRGAYPTLRNFSFLKRLELKTILSLVPEEPSYDLQCFADAEKITLKRIQAEKYKGEAQLLPTDLQESLQILINADCHPVYIHCLDGRHVVGLIIMVLRKLMQWDVHCNHWEYRKFTKEIQDEVAFVSDYAGPINIPERIPSWLWEGTWRNPVTGLPKKIKAGVKLKFPAVGNDAKTHIGPNNLVSAPTQMALAADRSDHHFTGPPTLPLGTMEDALISADTKISSQVESEKSKAGRTPPRGGCAMDNGAGGAIGDSASGNFLSSSFYATMGSGIDFFMGNAYINLDHLRTSKSGTAIASEKKRLLDLGGDDLGRGDTEKSSLNACHLLSTSKKVQDELPHHLPSTYESVTPKSKGRLIPSHGVEEISDLRVTPTRKFSKATRTGKESTGANASVSPAPTSSLHMISPHANTSAGIQPMILSLQADENLAGYSSRHKAINSSFGLPGTSRVFTEGNAQGVRRVQPQVGISGHTKSAFIMSNSKQRGPLQHSGSAFANGGTSDFGIDKKFSQPSVQNDEDQLPRVSKGKRRKSL